MYELHPLPPYQVAQPVLCCQPSPAREVTRQRAAHLIASDRVANLPGPCKRGEVHICNLYNLKVSRWELISYYNANEDFRGDIERGELEKPYVSPGREGWVIRSKDGKRGLDHMSWGWPNPCGGKPVVNVRNYSSPFWRSALANPERRCLVPFTDFQEWTVEPDPATGKKRPHWFSLPSRQIGTFAGIWRPSERGPIYAFLTCGYDGDAQEHVVGAIHPKAIPVILHDEDFDRWLTAPVEEALSLACAFPSQLIAVA